MWKRGIWLLSVLLTAAVLIATFFFSSQDAEASTGVSLALAQALARLFQRTWQWAEIRRFEGFLRKAAHFTLYFLLGCGLTGMFSARGRFARWYWVLPVGALCATLDELHQMFSPGRANELRDVLLDSSAVLTAWLLLRLLWRFWHRLRRGEARV